VFPDIFTEIAVLLLLAAGIGTVYGELPFMKTKKCPEKSSSDWARSSFALVGVK